MRVINVLFSSHAFLFHGYKVVLRWNLLLPVGMRELVDHHLIRRGLSVHHGHLLLLRRVQQLVSPRGLLGNCLVTAHGLLECGTHLTAGRVLGKLVLVIATVTRYAHLRLVALRLLRDVSLHSRLGSLIGSLTLNHVGWRLPSLLGRVSLLRRQHLF